MAQLTLTSFLTALNSTCSTSAIMTSLLFMPPSTYITEHLGVLLPLPGEFFQQIRIQLALLPLLGFCSDVTFSVKPFLATLVKVAISSSLFYFLSMLFITICTTPPSILLIVLYITSTRMQVS